jgi:TRAP-type C4-dicarboxylate transport system permease small subunit
VELEGAPEWLRGIPTDRLYVLFAAAFAVSIAVARLLLDSRAAGRRLRQMAHALEGGVLALLLAAMIVFSFLQIILRNLADTGIIWIDPLLRHLVLWVGFLGATLATRKAHHINVDAVSRFFPLPALRFVRAFTNLLAAFVCLLLSNAGVKLVRDEAGFGSSGFLDIPTWMLQVVMPLSLLLMSSRFLGHAIAAARGDLEELRAEPVREVDA